MAGAGSPWPAIHAARESLAADLEGLTEAQWATVSLAPPWTVRDVLAHMTATTRMTPPRFVGKLAAAGFAFHRMTAKDVLTEEAVPPAAMLAQFRSLSARETAPPGPIDAMLGEAVVHSQDIRQPLAIAANCPIEVAVRVADFYKSSNLLIGAKRRIDGLALTANDASWTTGSGPSVNGPILSLVMAMTGRKAALADLTGDGVAQLSERFS